MKNSLYLPCFAAGHLGFLLVWPQGSLMAQAPRLSLSGQGVVIDAGSAGQFTLPPPGLRMRNDDYSGEKGAAELAGDRLRVKYPGGAVVEMAVSDAGKTVKVSASGLPASTKCFVFQTHLPIRLNMGGKFALGDKALQPFPEDDGKQILGEGWGESFTLLDASGGGFRMRMPGNFQQMQDNRVFNWAIFVHYYYFDLAGKQGKAELTFRFEGLDETTRAAAAQARDGAARKPNIALDRFGQNARKDYPGKVTSEEELRADVAKDAAALAAFQPNPNLDVYGGLKGSGKQYGLKKTGFFHVADAGGRKVLVTPEGNVFFQLAACGIASTDDFTTVKGREHIYEWLPDKNDETFKTAWRDGRPDWGVFSFYIANWIRKFGRPFTAEEWTGQVADRLRSWGFNSAGAFSINTGSMKSRNFPNVAFLPLEKGDGVQTLPERIGAAEILDPFVPGTEEALDRRFAARVAPQANDPLLIGWFLGNEQHYEELPKKIAAYKASQVAAKGRLVEMLREKYRDIAKFNAAWEPARPFAGFEDLKEEPLFIRTEAAAADMRAFYEHYLETYFSMVERVFRKHNPHHLLIGSRMTPGTSNNETAVRLGGKYTDVVSVNYYTYAIEEPFLKQVSDWSGGKPIILSEWYFSSVDSGLGVHREIKDQTERARAYRNYVEQAAALPFVVGSQWFIYGDQSITGRFFEGFTGEGNNTGLVDVLDRPYTELVEAAKETHARIYDVMMGREKPYAYDDPRFDGKATGAGQDGPRAESPAGPENGRQHHQLAGPPDGIR